MIINFSEVSQKNIEPLSLYNKWKGLRCSIDDTVMLAESYFFYPFEPLHYIKNLRKKTPSLISTEIWPSSVCNQKCTFCSSNKFNYSRGAIMDQYKLKDIISELAQCGNKIVRFSGGGEPFLLKGMDQILNHVNKKGMKSSIITNGTILNDKLKAIISNYSIAYRVSINAGNKSDYFKIHGSDDFNKVIRHMEEIAEERNRKNRGNEFLLGATIVINKDNLKSLGQLAQLIKNLGFDFLLARAENPVRPILKDEKREILREQLLYCNSLRDENFNFSGDLSTLAGESKKRRPGNLPCYATKIRAYINSNYKIFPCFSGIVHDCGSYGDLSKNSFIDIWRGNDHLSISKKLQNGDLLDYCNDFCSYVKFNSFANWALDKYKTSKKVKFEKIPKPWIEQMYPAIFAGSK